MKRVLLLILSFTVSSYLFSQTTCMNEAEKEREKEKARTTAELKDKIKEAREATANTIRVKPYGNFPENAAEIYFVVPYFLFKGHTVMDGDRSVEMVYEQRPNDNTFCECIFNYVGPFAVGTGYYVHWCEGPIYNVWTIMFGEDFYPDDCKGKSGYLFINTPSYFVFQSEIWDAYLKKY
ncbi:MAG: hypothetical protein V1647_05795 [Pseudomonadota bacterium]